MATPSHCAPFMVERAFPITNTVRVWPRDRLVITSGFRDWHAHWDRRGRCWIKSKRNPVLNTIGPPIDLALLLDSGRDLGREIPFIP